MVHICIQDDWTFWVDDLPISSSLPETLMWFHVHTQDRNHRILAYTTVLVGQVQGASHLFFGCSKKRGNQHKKESGSLTRIFIDTGPCTDAFESGSMPEQVFLVGITGTLLPPLMQMSSKTLYLQAEPGFESNFRHSTHGPHSTPLYQRPCIQATCWRGSNR